MTDHPKTKPCGGGRLACGAVVPERNRWFTGKFVTARGYRLEQEHFLSHRWLHNRTLHGWGVVEGLRVVPHPDPDCAGRWVVVRCGLALDCCGRELLLPKDTAFELPFVPREGEEGEEGEEAREEPRNGNGGDEAGTGDDRWYRPGEPEDEEAEEDEADGTDDEDEEAEPVEPWLLCLRYHEEELEPVPVLAGESECDPRRSEANLVRQTAVLAAMPLSEVEDDCWRRRGGGEPPCRDDCDDDLPSPEGSCLAPHCPCGSCVPLALFVPVDPEAGWPAGFEIDLDGRRTLRSPHHGLTHVAGINWPHGGELTLSELRDDRGGRLVIAFDRRLQPPAGEATGVNEHTFVVQYGGAQQDLELLSSNDEEGPAVEEGCRAVFQIDPAYLAGKRTIAGSVVYVTLRCDFVLDCHGTPVDGEHLGGRLPSGDGIPGGTFESWFRVVADGAAKETKR